MAPYVDEPYIVVKDGPHRWLIVATPSDIHRHGLVVANAPTEALANRCLRGFIAATDPGITTENGQQAATQGAHTDGNTY